MVRGRRHHVLQDVVRSRRRTPAPARSSAPAFIALPSSPPANTRSLPDDDRCDVWGYLLSTSHSTLLYALLEAATDPDTANARQLRLDLRTLYANTDGETAARLLKAMWQIDLKEGGNAQSHLNKFSAAHIELTQAADAFSDQVFACTIFESLPKSYRTSLPTCSKKANYVPKPSRRRHERMETTKLIQ
ncbi:hypothetical protein QFC21_007114 [Naganishia friedmannii]|uniref:Uncharacterized protein n=1 Tax=Naganishia friedmannii TaxID=89922 RepID=A0ACC2UXC4_9TREE|nr:hypothetical protein QFC21_007114 [Naganishia friedmannii]